VKEGRKEEERRDRRIYLYYHMSACG